MPTTITAAPPRYRRIASAPAPFIVIEQSDGSFNAHWLLDRGAPDVLHGMNEDPTILDDLASRLEAYFDGKRVDFSDVPLPRASSAAIAATAASASGVFTQRCWASCRAIPPGRTLSYGELAARAGSPGAARAAGQAMRRNPLPVIIPCHRVVNSSGGLHGYAGHTDDRSRSLAIKRMLLELERSS